MDPLQIKGVQQRLVAGGGGYEVVHSSPSLEIGVYVLVAPEPDRQQPHEVDEAYIVLEGRGTLEIAGDTVELAEGHAAFVPAGAEHRFTGYENLSLLVVFAGADATMDGLTFDAAPGPGDSEGGDIYAP